VKKIKDPQKTKLKLGREIVRSLQAIELRHVEGGTEFPRVTTFASGGEICCA
jgi:hypothetical protein